MSPNHHVLLVNESKLFILREVDRRNEECDGRKDGEIGTGTASARGLEFYRTVSYGSAERIVHPFYGCSFFMSVSSCHARISHPRSSHPALCLPLLLPDPSSLSTWVGLESRDEDEHALSAGP